MSKRKENKSGLSRIAINLIIILLIVIIAGVIFFLVRDIMNNQGKQEVFDDSTLDLKISQVQKINDNTLDVTVKRNEGEGEFVALSFAVDDGALMEVIRKNISMEELENETFSLNFVLLNSSKIKRVSVTPIFIDKDGNEVIGNVKDEYITPNVCSNYCPTGAQCGVNDCGVKCGSGCNSGYLCLNYKCIKEKTSSGGGGGSSGGGSTTTCTDTCASLVKQCGTQTICGVSTNCGTCSTGYVCNLGLCIEESTCTDTCSSLGHNCGTDLWSIKLWNLFNWIYMSSKWNLYKKLCSYNLFCFRKNMRNSVEWMWRNIKLWNMFNWIIVVKLMELA